MDIIEELPIEDWFWQWIEKSKPSLQALAVILEKCKRQQLEKYMVYYDIASSIVYEPDSLLVIESITLSEDDVEDLTDWIVGQGRALWLYAIESEQNLPLLWAVKAGKSTLTDYNINAWQADMTNQDYMEYDDPKYLAYIIYAERFDTDYFKVQETLHDRYDAL